MFAHRGLILALAGGGAPNKRKAAHQRGGPPDLCAILVGKVVAADVVIDLGLEACLKRGLALVLLPRLDYAPRQQLRLDGLPHAALHRLFEILKVDSDLSHRKLVGLC